MVGEQIQVDQIRIRMVIVSLSLGLFGRVRNLVRLGWHLGPMIGRI